MGTFALPSPSGNCGRHSPPCPAPGWTHLVHDLSSSRTNLLLCPKQDSQSLFWHTGIFIKIQRKPRVQTVSRWGQLPAPCITYLTAWHRVKAFSFLFKNLFLQASLGLICNCCTNFYGEHPKRQHWARPLGYRNDTLPVSQELTVRWKGQTDVPITINNRRPRGLYGDLGTGVWEWSREQEVGEGGHPERLCQRAKLELKLEL